MAGSEREYQCVKCTVPNCRFKQFESDITVYVRPPNGKDQHGQPVQVTNCSIGPEQVKVSEGVVYDCESFEPMNAG
jgi:hypothetical protein